MDINERIEEALCLVKEAEQLHELSPHFKQWRKDQRQRGKADVAKDRGTKPSNVKAKVMKALSGVAKINRNQTSGDQIIAYTTEKEGMQKVAQVLIRALGVKPKGDGYPVKNPKHGGEESFWFELGKPGRDSVNVSYGWNYKLSDNSIRKTKDGKRIIDMQILVD